MIKGVDEASEANQSGIKIHPTATHRELCILGFGVDYYRGRGTPTVDYYRGGTPTAHEVDLVRGRTPKVPDHDHHDHFQLTKL